MTAYVNVYECFFFSPYEGYTLEGRGREGREGPGSLLLNISLVYVEGLSSQLPLHKIPRPRPGSSILKPL